MISTFFLFGCSPKHDGSTDSASDGIIPNPNPDPVLEAAAVSIFNDSCITCHDGSQNPDLRTSAIPALKENTFYLRIGLGEASTIYTRMTNSSAPMPEEGLLPQADADAIKAWIDDLGIIPENPTGPTAATFSEIETNILAPKCYSCHATSGANKPAFQNYQDVRDFIVAPFNLSSVLYTAVTLGASATGNIMPKNQTPLSQEDIDAIESWIMDGALNN